MAGVHSIGRNGGNVGQAGGSVDRAGCSVGRHDDSGDSARGRVNRVDNSANRAGGSVDRGGGSADRAGGGVDRAEGCVGCVDTEHRCKHWCVLKGKRHEAIIFLCSELQKWVHIAPFVVSISLGGPSLTWLQECHWLRGHQQM